MTSLWIWSNLPQYSIAELEEHKLAVKKVLAYRRNVASMGIGQSLFTFSGTFNTNYELEQQLKEIDDEIKRRKQQMFADDASVAIMSARTNNQLSPYYINAKQVKLESEVEKKAKQLESERKTTKELRKRLEEQSKELQEERNTTDRLQKLMDNHICNDGSTFSDVEADE